MSEKELDIKHSLVVKLKVEVFDKDGKLINSTEKDSDLIMNNFGKFLTAILQFNSDTIPGDSTATNDVGTVRQIGTIPVSIGLFFYGTSFDAAGAVYNWAGGGGFSGTGGTKGQIGTGVTAPARTDFALQTPVETRVNLNADATYFGGAITFAFSVPITATRTITEAGIFFNWVLFETTSGAAPNEHFLIFRDVFAGLSVVAGNTVTVSYTIAL